MGISIEVLLSAVVATGERWIVVESMTEVVHVCGGGLCGAVLCDTHVTTVSPFNPFNARGVAGVGVLLWSCNDFFWPQLPQQPMLVLRQVDSFFVDFVARISL